MDNTIATPGLAKELLEIALKYGSFCDFLQGSDLYGLYVKDPYGYDVFSAMHVMEAIYDKHKEDPSLNLGKMTESTIINLFRSTRFDESILHLMEVIFYQANAQKNGRAAFQIDLTEVFNEVKDNLKRNEEYYRNSKIRNNGITENTWAKMEIYNMRAKTELGIEIIQ